MEAPARVMAEPAAVATAPERAMEAPVTALAIAARAALVPEAVTVVPVVMAAPEARAQAEALAEPAMVEQALAGSDRAIAVRCRPAAADPAEARPPAGCR